MSLLTICQVFEICYNDFFSINSILAVFGINFAVFGFFNSYEVHSSKVEVIMWEISFDISTEEQLTLDFYRFSISVSQILSSHFTVLYYYHHFFVLVFIISFILFHF